MILDEIDKLRSDFHGDPSSAMLEVLDPEQNRTFTDHYIDIPFDLSEVFFITTANVIDTIPPPLRDRMEIIEVSSYTSVEKLQIAKRYLVPRLLSEHGLKPENVRLSDETLESIIQHFTREAGVRELQRKISAILRGVAEKIVIQMTEHPDETIKPIEINPGYLKEFLGPEKFFPETPERVSRPGIATGMAWTPHGGDLIFIEATAMPSGKGHLILTGQLGDVMKESAQIALSLVRSMSSQLFHSAFDFGTQDIHIHVPAGAIPKDGPSAGVPILAALASLVLGKRLEPSLAMTGEITLRGVILPVGGIKEKVLAAHRAELRKIILPQKNEQDLVNVPSDVRNQIRFVFADSVEEVLSQTLEIRNTPWFAQTAA